MKAKLENFITQALCLLVMALALGHALYGCATLGNVAAGACSPVASEVAAVAKAFAPASYQSDVDKLIKAGTALCKVQAAVDQELGGQALLKAGDASPDIATLEHMRAWRAANP